MQYKGVEIENTFAEAFPMWAARLIITAGMDQWAQCAANAASGLATSIIGCGCEAGIDYVLKPEKTSDGRPGYAILLFTISKEDLERELLKRIGQGVLTTATSACYNGLESNEHLAIGHQIRYFGDGYQSSKLLAGQRYWRIPVADGEFVVDEKFGIIQGVGGGNIILMGTDLPATLNAAVAAADAVRSIPGALAPFPGGICRSPSKIGSRYRSLSASTNDAFCPTLRGQVDSQLTDEAQVAYEIVIDGLNEAIVAQAMRAAVVAACQPGIIKITAANYGGELGPYHFSLYEILESDVT